MCRVATIALADDARSPARARAWTERWLGCWEIDDDVTTLLVTELVTNAVKHTRTSSTLTLAITGDMIEVAVTDGGPSALVVPAQRVVTAPASAQPYSESGRRRMIVEALSDSWGVTPAARGKHIWFRRAIAAHWAYSASCE